jgi:hypothetical protein
MILPRLFYNITDNGNIRMQDGTDKVLQAVFSKAIADINLKLSGVKWYRKPNRM